MKLAFLALTALILTMVLTGCGQTGGLYLPDESATVEQTPAPADASDEEARKKK